MRAGKQIQHPIFALLFTVLVLVGCTTSPRVKEGRFLKGAQDLLTKKNYAGALLELRNAALVAPKDAEPYYRIGLLDLEAGDTRGAIAAFRKATQQDPNHPGAKLKLAELMVASRDRELVDQAAIELRTLIATAPNNPEAYDALAVAESELGKVEAATQRLEETLRKFPTHLQSSQALASLKLNQNDLRGAQEVLVRAVANAPKSAEAALALGQLYVILKQPEKAEAEVRRAVQLDSKNAAALKVLATLQVAAKRMDDAERTYKQLSAFPDRDYKPLHAAFLYKTGKQRAALAEFRQLVEADPNDRAARSQLVMVLLETNKTSEAEAVLNAALKRNPRDIDALLQRSQMRLREARPSDAEKDLREVIHFAPDSAEAIFALSQVLKSQGRDKNERGELNKALELKPLLIGARLALAASYSSVNQPEAALNVMDQTPKSQKDLLAVVIQRNWILLQLGRTQELKAGLERTLKAGRPPEVVLQSAMLKLSQRDYAAARSDAQEVLQKLPDNINATLVLAESYTAQNQTLQAIESLKQLAAARPKSAQLQYLLGQWYMRSENQAEARKAYEAAVSADAQFQSATLAIANLDIRTGALAAARERLGRMIASQPNNVTALLLFATVEQRAGDISGAISTWRNVLTADRTNLVALNNIAYHTATQDSGEALKLAQQAAEIAPDSPVVQDTLGWVYYQKGLYPSAITCFKTALAKDPTPRRKFHLGIAYLRLGDKDLGQPLVELALQQDPSLAKTEHQRY
jgi:tetratricopeptide (TPR) repeat protein